MVSLHVCVLHCNHRIPHSFSTEENNIQQSTQLKESNRKSCKVFSRDLHLSKQQITQTVKERESNINKVGRQTGGSDGEQSLRIKEAHSRMFSVPALRPLHFLCYCKLQTVLGL